MPRPFFSDCVAWPATCQAHFGTDGMEALHRLIDTGEEISIDVFRAELEEGTWFDLLDTLGYARPGEDGIAIEEDPYVQFKRAPDTGAVFAVHSAIEYVFAAPEEIARIQEAALAAEEEANATRDTTALVLVHPGSLCGSARMQVGKLEADCARDAILQEVADHEGPLVVIDGFLSDELSAAEQAKIENALARNAEAGHLALRLWGCDNAELPYPEWRPVGADMSGAVFGGQDEVASAIAPRLDGHAITVTGAWANDSLESGCATSVLLALRTALGREEDIAFSDHVLHEPDFDDPEDECETDDTPTFH